MLWAGVFSFPDMRRFIACIISSAVCLLIGLRAVDGQGTITFHLFNAGTTNFTPGSVAVAGYYNGVYQGTETTFSDINPGQSTQNSATSQANYTYAAYGTPPGGSQVVSSQQPGSAVSGDIWFVLFPGGTNHCMNIPQTVSNPTGLPVLGYWILNGATVYTTSIGPGLSATYTFTCVDASNSKMSWGYNSSPPTMGTDGNGNIVSTGPANNGSSGGDGNILTNSSGSGASSGSAPVSAPIVLTNGPIAWGSTTSSAVSVDAAGFGILHGDNQQALLALNQIAQDLVNQYNMQSNGFWFDGMWIQTNTAATTNAIAKYSGGGGGSNTINLNLTNNVAVSNYVAVTNFVNPDTNALAWLGQIATNTSVLPSLYGDSTNGQAHATNLLSTNFIAGNVTAGTALGNTLATALASADISSVKPSVSEPGSASVTIPVIGAQVMTLSTSLIPGWSLTTIARDIMAALVFLYTFRKMVQVTEDKMLEALNQRQMQGNQQMAEGLTFGANLDIVSGLVYLAIVAAALVAIPTAITYTLFAFKGNISDVSGDFAGLASASSGFPWAVVTSLFPLSALITCFFEYFAYRYVLVFPALMVSRCIILFMLA